MIADLKPYPTMKDSGIEWLGEVPEHWDLVPNRALMRLNKQVVGERADDYTLLSLTKRGIIARDMENLEGKFPTSFDTYQVVEPGDLIFCLFDIDETPRAVGLSLLNGMITGAYTKFVCLDEQAGRFIYLLYLSLDNGKLLKPLYSGLRKVITKSTFLSAKLALPQAPERIAIVRYLDYVDRRVRRYVRAKQKLIGLLEEQKQAIIHRAVTRGLDPDVPLKSSGVEWLGDVPEHWEVRPVRRLITFITSGSRGWAQFYSDDGDLFIQSGDLGKAMGLVLDKVHRVAVPPGTEGQRTRIMKDDVLICITGALTGNVAHVDEQLPPAYVNQHVALVRPCARSIVPQFLSYALYSRHGQEQFGLSQYGGTKQGLGLDDVRDVIVLLPPMPEQLQICEFLNEYLKHLACSVSAARREIDLLREYHTRLIADVVTGKLDVREAVASLPEEPDEPEALYETDALGDADEETEMVEKLEE